MIQGAYNLPALLTINTAVTLLLTFPILFTLTSSLLFNATVCLWWF
jgi:hypothetical protein